MPGPSLIVSVIQRYFEDWLPPEDSGRDWAKTCCPFHGDTRPSAAVSFRYNAFRCLACKAGGTAVGIIKEQEGVSFAEAHRIATSISSGSDHPVPPKPARQPRRKVFGEQGIVPVERPGREVHARVRRRAFGGP